MLVLPVQSSHSLLELTATIMLQTTFKTPSNKKKKLYCRFCLTKTCPPPFSTAGANFKMCQFEDDPSIAILLIAVVQ